MLTTDTLIGRFFGFTLLTIACAVFHFWIHPERWDVLKFTNDQAPTISMVDAAGQGLRLDFQMKEPPLVYSLPAALARGLASWWVLAPAAGLALYNGIRMFTFKERSSWH